MNLLQPMAIAGLLITGMGVALLGTIKLPLSRKLRIDEARVGGLVSLFGFAMIPVILSVGFITDQVGGQAVVVVGSLMTAGALAVLALANGYGSALLAVLLLSAAWSALVNVINVLTPIAFGGTILYATNVANFYFGLGAFLTPFAATFILRRVNLTVLLGALAVVALSPALLALGVDFQAEAISPTPSEASGNDGFLMLLGNVKLWLCALALFFYGPLEASMAAWATTYLSGRGVSEAKATGILSAFWLAFMASRLAAAFLVPAGYEGVWILTLSLACVAVLSAVVWNRSQSAASLFVLAAGLVFGPVFPTIMAILLGSFEPALHGRAVGLLFAIGGIGWTTIPILIGAYARRTNVQKAFLIAVAAAVGLSFISMLLYLN